VCYRLRPNMALKPTSRIGAIFSVWMRNTALPIHQPPSAGWLSASVSRLHQSPCCDNTVRLEGLSITDIVVLSSEGPV
jgi:hypothetical protein